MSRSTISDSIKSEHQFTYFKWNTLYNFCVFLEKKAKFQIENVYKLGRFGIDSYFIKKKIFQDAERPFEIEILVE